MKTLLLLWAFALFTLSSRQVNFLQKYAGSYYATASYADYEFVELKADGTCKWTYTWESKGKSQRQKKLGKWTATEGSIRISLDNGIGTIVEIYVIKNQEFVNKDDPNRFLTMIKRI